MECLKCNSELTEIKLPLSDNVSYRCEQCHNKIVNDQLELDSAIKQKELNQARLESGITKRLMGTTLNSFKTSCNESSQALAMCNEYLLKVKSKEPVGGLILIGRCGTGKTMLAAGMVEELGFNDFTSRIRTISGLVLELKETWRNDSTVSESELINFYTNYVDLLIIDEIGCQRNSDTESLLLFSIIDGRYNNMLPTVLISNLSLQDFKVSIGERCYDRLKDDGGKIVAFNWDSARK